AESGRAFGGLARQAEGDPYLLAAVLSSVNKDNLQPVITSVFQGDLEDVWGPPAALLIGPLFGLADALRMPEAMTQILNRVGRLGKGEWIYAQWAILGRVLDALESRNRSLDNLREEGNAELKAAVARLDPLFASARKWALEKERETYQRI